MMANTIRESREFTRFADRFYKRAATTITS
jgi:hypothetical protein